MNSIFVRFPFKSDNKCLDCGNEGISSCELRVVIAASMHNDDFTLHCNGKKVVEDECIPPNATVSVLSTLPGGKGGFGSMLRAIGAQIEKTTNREACRDLSGRRLRDINEEQRLKKWIASKAEREAEKTRRKKERLERLKSQPKHSFVDFEYEKEISALPERIDDALTAGIQKINKRPLELKKEPYSDKKKRLWFDEDMSSDSDTSSEKDSLNNLSCEEDDSKEVVTDPQSDDPVSCEGPSTSRSWTPREETQLETNAVENVESASTSQPQTGSDASQCLQEQPNDSSGSTQEEMDENIFVGFCSASELESLGLEKLKCALMARGLKCGGSITDRALRLWAVKDLQPHQYPKNMLAKPKK